MNEKEMRDIDETNPVTPLTLQSFDEQSEQYCGSPLYPIVLLHNV